MSDVDTLRKALPGVEIDAPRPCHGQRSLHARYGSGDARWLVHQKCPACGGSVRDWLCDGCWERTERAIEAGQTGAHRCGHRAPFAEFIVSAVAS